MSFLHPEFLYLAPLLAVPVLIHLLNRIRYRRMRWAAIEFLLATERRAVRRARLRQILLMVLRTLVLAAALGALAQPLLSGGLAALLGGSSQVAILLDASASMSAADASGAALDRAKRVAAEAVRALPRGVRAAAGTFSARYESLLREPIQDHAAVASAIESAELTSGAADVPQAIRAAAESLARGGGGGTIWLLTDLRRAGWHAAGAGAWDEVRQTLQEAGSPRVIVTDTAPAVASNLAISGVRVSPEVLVEGDVPRLAATIALEGSSGAATNVRLFFDGRLVDSRAVQLAEPGAAEAVFHLPALKPGVHAGYLELEHDAFPSDDRHYFLLRPAEGVPVLVVDGAPSPVPFEGAGDFLAAALSPLKSDDAARSPFAVKTIPLGELAGAALADYAAVCLADVPRLDAEAVRALRTYVTGGGLVVIFPGPHTDAAAWNASGFPGIRIESIAQTDGDKKMKVTWTSAASPVTATLAAEGLDRLVLARCFRFAADGPGEVLAAAEGGGPFLVRTQLGKGKVYVFSVSCRPDFSNLPFTPVFLLTVHRALLGHLVEVGDPLSVPAFASLEFSLKPGAYRMLTPDGRVLPLMPREGRPGRAVFDQTQRAGIYRLVSGDAAPKDAEAVPAVAAINVPSEESSLARIEPREVRLLLPGVSVHFAAPEGGQDLGGDTGGRSAASGFLLAAIAVAFLASEVVLAWTMGRPSPGVQRPMQEAV
jgi:hypothetical protein